MKYHYIEIKTNSTLSPPDKTFLGTTIRGTFGYFLRDQACFYLSSNKKNTKERKDENDYFCEICSHFETCVYDRYYSKSRNTDVPRRIRFDAKLNAKSFDFGIYLFDGGAMSLHFVLIVLKRMLQSRSITSHRYAFPNSTIKLNGKKIDYDISGFPLLSKEHLASPKFCLSSPSDPISLSITFLSPAVFSYRKNDDIPSDKEMLIKDESDIELKDIIDSILFRKMYYESGQRQRSPDYGMEYSRINRSGLSFQNIYKQKEEDPIYGIMGVMKVYDADPVTYGLLKYGEIIGVGKKTVMGAGKIKIEVLNEKIV